MEQNVTNTNDVTHIPGNLPGDEGQPGSVEQGLGLTEEQLAELLEEQAQEPATPGAGEDTVLFVETISVPEQGIEDAPEDIMLGGAPGDVILASAPEDMLLEGIDLEVSAPWYRSRWMFVGTSLVAGTALSIGAVLLVRGLRRRNRRLAVSQSMIRPLRRSRKRLARGTAPLLQGRFGGLANQLSGQANSLTSQVQGRFSRLTNRTSAGTSLLNPLQRGGSARSVTNNAWRQLAQFSTRARGRFSSLGVPTRTRAAQAIKGTQESLAQLGKGMTLGVEKTGESLKRSWKIGRNFALGVSAGAVWAALFTPQSGETTRQRLAETFQARLKRE